MIFLFAQSSEFSVALKSIFPNWIFAVAFVAACIAAIVVSVFVKRAALALSARMHRAFSGRGNAVFVVVDSFLSALPVSVFAGAIRCYEFFRFPDGCGNASELAAAQLLDRAFWVIVIVAQTQVLWHLVRLPILFVRACAERHGRTSALATFLPLAGASMRVIVGFGGLLLVVRVLTDTSPSEILAMIGIGGLAIGLASQDTVKNFFGTAMLVIDRPFRVGDVIDFGAGTPGTVVRIGLRSTRLRTPDDHEISVPNADLANRVVTMISARRKIRRELNLGLVYDTPPEKIEEACRIVAEILNNSGKLAAGTSPSVFFSDFGDSALNLRVIYHFGGASGADANAFAHATNLEILRRFADAGIEFAFPTRTVVVRRG